MTDKGIGLSDDLRSAASKTGRLFVVLVAVGAAAYLLTGIVSIKPEEVGVLLRFGSIAGPSLPSGMHPTFPWPIDRVIRVPIRQVRTFDVDLFYPSEKQPVPPVEEPHLLTGDKNLVQMKVKAQFSIVSPGDYLFSAADPEGVAHDIVASALMRTAAGLPVDTLLTIGRLQLQEKIKTTTQIQVDALKLGLHVRSVEVRDISPPRAVLPNFKEVVNAQMQRNTKKHQAESRKSSLLARANSLARKKVEQSRGGKSTKVDRAKGEAARFKSLLAKYRTDPKPLRRRLYLEMIEELLPRFRQVIAVEGTDADAKATIRIGIRE